MEYDVTVSRVDLMNIVRECNPEKVQNDLLLYLLYKDDLDASLQWILLGRKIISDEEVEISDLAWYLQDVLGPLWTFDVVHTIASFILTKGEHEKLWDMVQELRMKFQTRKSKYWELVLNASRTTRCPDIVQAFVMLFPKLLHGTPLQDVYEQRPLTTQDTQQIVQFFQKRSKLSLVNEHIFQNIVWKYFEAFFTSMVVLKPYYFNHHNLIAGWMSKEKAEHILNTAFRNFNRQALGACVIRWSESRPGLIALAANVGQEVHRAGRIRHYRIIVEVPDSRSEGYENIFRVNVGSGGSCKLFKTLNEVLYRMQITHVCVEDGFGLIKREDAFEHLDLNNIDIPIMRVRNVLEVDDSNFSEDIMVPGVFERQETRAEGEMKLTINHDDSIRCHSHHPGEGGVQGEMDLLFFE